MDWGKIQTLIQLLPNSSLIPLIQLLHIPFGKQNPTCFYLYLDFISLHMGLSGRGDCVSHHTVYADDSHFLARTVLTGVPFLLLCKVPHAQCSIALEGAHFNAFWLSGFTEVGKEKCEMGIGCS